MIDKKKAVESILIALKAKKPEAEEEMEETEENVDELEVAAEEILAAIQEKDTKMLVEALKSFIEMCD